MLLGEHSQGRGKAAGAEQEKGCLFEGTLELFQSESKGKAPVCPVCPVCAVCAKAKGKPNGNCSMYSYMSIVLEGTHKGRGYIHVH